MNRPAYLIARGWTLYRKPWNGWPAKWVHPRESKVYFQNEAVRIEKEIERREHELAENDEGAIAPDIEAETGDRVG